MIMAPVREKAATAYTLAVDLGATNLRVGLVSLGSDYVPAIVEQVKGPTPENDPEALVDKIIADAKEVVSRHPDLKFKTIGVSACGQIADERTAMFLPNLGPKVRDVRLADALEKAFPFAKCRVANDANAEALSESTYGAAKDYADSIFVTISSGIGTGYVYKHQLINTMMEGGRIIITFDGKLVETEYYLSGNGISRLCQERGLGNLKAYQFFQRLREHDQDPKLVAAYNDWVKYLGCFFGNLQRMFNVDVYVLSGGVMKSQDVFLKDLLKVSNAYLKPYPLKPVVFLDAKFGQDAGLLGGAACGFSLEK